MIGLPLGLGLVLFSRLLARQETRARPDLSYTTTRNWYIAVGVATALSSVASYYDQRIAGSLLGILTGLLIISASIRVNRSR